MHTRVKDLLKIVPVFGLITVSSFLFSSFKKENIQTASNPLSGWDKQVLKQANTGEAISNLSAEEKKLILYTNLCRMKPKLFCQTVLDDYLKKHTEIKEGVASLKKQLNADKPCCVLVADGELCGIASSFATRMGEEGNIGHEDFQNRIQPLMSRFNKVGENCNYGDSLAIDALMALLIDWSDPINLGHRKNLLDADFKAIGVAKQPHSKYNWNFVMEFAGEKPE